jgi:glycosyltransferase involved in cell wall biosynthesis
MEGRRDLAPAGIRSGTDVRLNRSRPVRVAVDIRPLLEPRRRGVSIYAAEIVAALARRRAHRYVLFSNARAGVPVGVPAASDAVEHRFFRYPNRAFNAAVAFSGRPRLEDMLGGIDAAYLPNLNFAATRAPLVATVHDLSFVRHPEFFTAKQRAWHRLVDARRLLARAAAVAAVSLHTKEDLIELFGIAPERIAVVSPAADPSLTPRTADEVAALRRRLGLARPFFLYLGAIEPRKNIAGIITAFAAMPKDVDLVIAGGPGWLDAPVRDRARSSPARDRIKFLDYVPPADKPALYSAAVALVYPSFYEGFGIPPLEAMACGTPVIASHATSLGEVAGDAGLLVDPHSVEEIAAAMLAVLEDHDLAALMRERGLARARMFDWDASAEALERLFAEIGRQRE